MGLLSYSLRRLLLSVLVVFGISVITFTIARLIPSEPAALWIGARATPEQVARVRVELGLDRPLYEQYLRYLSSLLAGDWGLSIRTHRPVLTDILTFLPASLELILTGVAIAIIVGVPLGVVSATRRNSALDHGARVFSITGVSMPTFWLGMMLQLVFFRQLGILPVAGRLDTYVSIVSPIQRITGFLIFDALITGNWIGLQSALLHIILPALTLAAFPTGLITRMVRSTMSEVLSQEYITAARAYGVPERTVTYVYALKNAIAPAITVLALSFAYSLVETFLIETVFNWPGLGLYASTAIISVDFPAIMGITLFVAFVYISLNLAVDIVQALLDPRIRLE